MIRSRGFSLLEIMLAMVVVAIGISVLLAFSASNQRQTNNESTGNDYSLLVNDMLAPFVTAVAECNEGNVDGCDLLKKIRTNSASATYSAQQYFTDMSLTPSSNQITALNAAGIDLNKITVSITPQKSDCDKSVSQC